MSSQKMRNALGMGENSPKKGFLLIPVSDGVGLRSAEFTIFRASLGGGSFLPFI